MPAPNEIVLYNFGNAFERACDSILAGLGLPALIQGANDTLPESRVEIVFQRGAPLNEGVRPDGRVVYDYFAGTLSFRVVTVRPDTQPSLLPGVSTLHEEFSATILAHFKQQWTDDPEQYSTPFNSTNLPYYKVTKLRPESEQRDFDPRWIEDYTRNIFYVEFGIRSDAWPN